MILNLRGTCGSGKSFAGFYLINNYPAREIYEDGWNKTKTKHIGYELPGNLFVLGRYYEGITTGGVDGFPAPKVFDAIARYARIGHVFVESLFLSSSVAPWEPLIKEFGTDLTIAFLDTPVERCIESTYARKGFTTQLKEDAIRQHHKGLGRLKDRLVQRVLDGELFNIAIVPRERSVESCLRLLHDGGWKEKK